MAKRREQWFHKLSADRDPRELPTLENRFQVEINGLDTWLWATLIVWFASMLAGVLLPLIFLRNAVEERRS